MSDTDCAKRIERRVSVAGMQLAAAVRRLLRLVAIAALSLCCQGCLAAGAADIPKLDWQERSDWINVRTDVDPQAKGDGKNDDTAAVQAAIDQVAKGDSGSTVYLPAGTYRITATLVAAPRPGGVGMVLIGHGRDTRIVWDGPAGGVMLWSKGSPLSQYIGINWDGRNKAAVGVDHVAVKRFETAIRHRHEAFRNFTVAGIRTGDPKRPCPASAEIAYDNCLFVNCGTGVRIRGFNYFNDTFDGCEFRNCGTGIYCRHGNFFARNCHFEASRDVDIHDHRAENGSSVRRCTSHGSRRFIYQEEGTIGPLAVQDCYVRAWKAPDGAIVLNGVPAMVFDCRFSDPPNDHPPIA